MREKQLRMQKTTQKRLAHEAKLKALTKAMGGEKITNE